MENIVVCRGLKVFNSNKFCKTIKDIIKYKGCLKSARIKRYLKMPVLRRTYIFFTTHKAYFFVTLPINLPFLFLKVVSSSSKNTNNPPPVILNVM